MQRGCGRLSGMWVGRTASGLCSLRSAGARGCLHAARLNGSSRPKGKASSGRDPPPRQWVCLPPCLPRRLSGFSGNFEWRSSRPVRSGWERSGCEPSPRGREVPPMQKVSGRTVGTTATDSESALPAEVQRRLGELIEAASEGLLALSVGAGLRLVHELMELEVEALAGPKGKHDAGRIVKRQGYEQGSVTLGGRRVPVRRPRVKRVDDGRE